MTDKQTENAIIKGTFLGIEDHGFLTFFLYLEGDGWGGGFGGFDCSSEFLPEAIKEILEVVEVDSWENLKGKMVRVDEHELGMIPERIGHPIKDKWFYIRKLAKKYA